MEMRILNYMPVFFIIQIETLENHTLHVKSTIQMCSYLNGRPLSFICSADYSWLKMLIKIGKNWYTTKWSFAVSTDPILLLYSCPDIKLRTVGTRISCMFCCENFRKALVQSVSRDEIGMNLLIKHHNSKDTETPGDPHLHSEVKYQSTWSIA